VSWRWCTGEQHVAQ